MNYLLQGFRVLKTGPQPHIVKRYQQFSFHLLIRLHDLYIDFSASLIVYEINGFPQSGLIFFSDTLFEPPLAGIIDSTDSFLNILTYL